jgi:hypothetical protein
MKFQTNNLSVLNKFKLLKVFVSVLLSSLSLFSQDFESIKNNKDYYWGEGVGKNLEAADKNSLLDLISQISVNIESEYRSKISQKNQAFIEDIQILTKTYSSATLDRTERLVKESSGTTTVLRYITRKQMEDVFNERKDKIISYLKSGYKAELDNRIGDALKCYYWSFVLLLTHPDLNKIRYAFDEGNPEILLIDIPNRIKTIFSKLKFTCTYISEKPSAKNAVINITYNNFPVQNMEYSYFTGTTWTGLYSAKDGVGVIDLYGEATSFNEVRANVEYKFKNNSKIDIEVYNIFENTNLPEFSECQTLIKLTKQDKIEKKIEDLSTTSQTSIKNTALTTESNVLLSDISTENNSLISEFKNGVASRDYLSIRPLFTEEGYKDFEKIISYGNASLLPQKKVIQEIKINNETVIRSLPMLFYFKKSNKKFVDDVVLTLDETGKISSISFALTEKSLSDILNKSDKFATSQEKFQLIKLMEDYKSAYNLGRLDYLEQIFSDDALIIVGKSVSKNINKDETNHLMKLKEKDINYVKLTKKEYLDRLRVVFMSNEVVNIQFDETNVKRASADAKIFGIQISQNYYSSNYGDSGYLFLMVDITDSLKPKIHVRTWQPEKKLNEKLFEISDFHF